MTATTDLTPDVTTAGETGIWSYFIQALARVKGKIDGDWRINGCALMAPPEKET